jgi:hypothetical protein
MTPEWRSAEPCRKEPGTSGGSAGPEGEKICVSRCISSRTRPYNCYDSRPVVTAMPSHTGDTRTLRRHAKTLGFVVSRTKRGHLKCRAPSGALVFVASTPSDHRALANALATLRRVARTRTTPEPPHA